MWILDQSRGIRSGLEVDGTNEVRSRKRRNGVGEGDNQRLGFETKLDPEERRNGEANSARRGCDMSESVDPESAGGSSSRLHNFSLDLRVASASAFASDLCLAINSRRMLVVR
jgi:hypothetical protein